MDKDENVSRLDYQIVAFGLGYLLAELFAPKVLDWLAKRRQALSLGDGRS
jgi:hypothetical protein